jgi:hypothetical protein
MSLSWRLTAGVVLAATLPALAQDPFQVAPKAYRLEFENDWVRVVRVHFAPHEKIPVHQHPKVATVYLYLRDAGMVRFSHKSDKPDENYSLERPAVKAGAFRLARAVREVHEVENLSDLPSDYVRVELKTEVKERDVFRGRHAPEPGPPGAKVRFDNGQIRIIQIDCAAYQACAELDHNEPSVIVAMTPATLQFPSRTLSLAAGDARFEAAGASERSKNTGNTPIQLFRIDLKTQPAHGELTGEPHAH